MDSRDEKKKIVFEVFKKLTKKRFDVTLNKPTEKESASIIKFLNEIGEQDAKFISDFLVFQFSSYENTKPVLGNHIPLSWLIGSKALKRWENKKDGAYHIIEKKRKDLGFKSNEEGYTNSTQKGASEAQKENWRRLSSTTMNEWWIRHCLDCNSFIATNNWCIKCEAKAMCQNREKFIEQLF